jgi:hypothetical protein
VTITETSDSEEVKVVRQKRGFALETEMGNREGSDRKSIALNFELETLN